MTQSHFVFWILAWRLIIFWQTQLAWSSSVLYLVTRQQSTNQRGPEKATIRKDVQKLLNTSFYPVTFMEISAVAPIFPGLAHVSFPIREWRKSARLPWLSKCRHPQFCSRGLAQAWPPFSQTMSVPYLFDLRFELWARFGRTHLSVVGTTPFFFGKCRISQIKRKK